MSTGNPDRISQFTLSARCKRLQHPLTYTSQDLTGEAKSHSKNDPKRIIEWARQNLELCTSEKCDNNCEIARLANSSQMEILRILFGE